MTIDRKKKGRQVEAARNDHRLLEAARDVFAVHGPEASVAAVATHAGVGIASLYRRYGGKEELLQRLCVLAMKQAIEAAETALADDDTWHGFKGYVAACVEFRSGALSSLAGSIAVTEEMRETSLKQRTLVEALVARAHKAHALRHDATALDVSLLVELFSRRSLGLGSEEDRVAAQRLLTIALDGLKSRENDELPGPPPSAQGYAQRWAKRS